MKSTNKIINAISVTALCSALFAFSVQISGASELFELISPMEAKEAMENPAPKNTLQSKGTIGAPIIKVLSPTADTGTLVSPVDIEMVFESPDNTAIDMESLKILYVMFIKQDVTNRILKHATINESKLVAKGAKLPKGNHTFIVEIQDAKNRKTSEEFSVTVSG